MGPVSILIIPDNGRTPFDPEGSEELLGKFVKLPVLMTDSAIAWTGPGGKPLVLWAGTGRIHPRDFAAVLTAIEQYNDDLEKRGISAAVMQSDRWT